MAGVAVMVRDKYAVRLAPDPASDSGWETPGPSHRQGPDSPQSDDGWPAPQVAEALDVALGTVYRVKRALPKKGWRGS